MSNNHYIILAHEHADAVLSLDDIRTVQPFSPTNDIDPTPMYLSQYAMESITVKFHYLAQKKLKPGQEVRRVTQLDWRVIDNDCSKTFVASGLQFFPLRVMHGEDYVCLGFLFGERSRVAYISDVSCFLPPTEYHESAFLTIATKRPETLFGDTAVAVNPETLGAMKKICPKKALLMGMTHEFDHHKDNEFLMEWSRREGIPVQLAYDGLRIPIALL